MPCGYTRELYRCRMPLLKVRQWLALLELSVNDILLWLRNAWECGMEVFVRG